MTGILLFALTGCAGGLDHFEGGDLLVMVYSADHEPITDATLRTGGRVLGRTDSFGRMVLPGLAAGEQRFLASAHGFVPQQVTLSFRNATQILYVSLKPLAPLCAHSFLAKDRAGLSELLELLESAEAPEEELSLVRALLMASENDHRWREEIATLSGSIGERRSRALLGAVEDAAP